MSSSIKKKIKGGSARRLADFLKVLRFSFPVPVVGASAFTFAVENKEVSRSRLALLNNFELDLLARPQGGNAGIQVSRIQMHNNYNIKNGDVKRIAKSNLVNCDLKLSGTVS